MDSIFYFDKNCNDVESLPMNCNYHKLILSAEYMDIAGNKYIQLFNLKINEKSNTLEVLNIRQPTLTIDKK